jgi:hypothetical protein
MKTRTEQIALVVELLAKTELEFALLIYPTGGQKEPFLVTSDPPPVGQIRAADGIARCASHDGTMVVGCTKREEVH